MTAGYLGNNIADTPVAAAVLIAGDGRAACPNIFLAKRAR